MCVQGHSESRDSYFLCLHLCKNVITTEDGGHCMSWILITFFVFLTVLKGALYIKLLLQTPPSDAHMRCMKTRFPLVI